MNGAVLPRPERETSLGALLFVAVSLAIHGGLLLYLNTVKPRIVETNRPLELVVFEVERPKPPPPPKEEEKKVEPPKPKPPIKVATVHKLPPPPPDKAPPPPNEPPPPETPPKPAPLVVGLSMSSTTSTGGFAAPVGNTLYGKTADRATNAADVKAYSAPKYTPIYQVDSAPTLLNDVKIPYPDQAKKAGIEGSVTLSIVVDMNGDVVNVRVIGGPGYGLNEAAREAMRKFKFKPAIKNGTAVSTEIKYAYTFLLD